MQHLGVMRPKHRPGKPTAEAAVYREQLGNQPATPGSSRSGLRLRGTEATFLAILQDFKSDSELVRTYALNDWWAGA